MNVEDREMLIRIHEKVIKIERAFEDTPYQKLVERVNNYTWMMRTAIVASCAAMIKSFWKG